MYGLMNISQSKIMEQDQIAAALCKFQAECPTIELNSEAVIKYRKKDGTGYNELRYKYASLGSVVNVIRPHLANNDLSFVHLTGDKGVRCVLMHSSGQYIESDWIKIKAGEDAKGQGASITYGRRYSLLAILGIVAEDDIDAPPQKEDNRNPISATAFKEAVDRILEGEIEVFIRVMMMFKLTEEQTKDLAELSLQRLAK